MAYELCDWDFERGAPARIFPDGRREGCDLPATVALGSRMDWHLCEACALLPRFKRFTVRLPLPDDPIDGPSRVAQEAPFDRERRHRRRDGRADWKICRWCGGTLTGRKTGWCAQPCVDEWLIRRDPAFARKRVAARDRGVCAQCDGDTDALHRFWNSRPWQNYANEPLQPFREALHRAWGRMFKASLGLSPGSRNSVLLDNRDRIGGYWDMDHIVPVEEGGGGCGLDNYQTLCLPCHRKKTAEQAATKAHERQVAKMAAGFTFLKHIDI